MAIGKVILLELIVVAGGKFAFPWLLRQVAPDTVARVHPHGPHAGPGGGHGLGRRLRRVDGGAFLAGMVVGQTEVSHQAAADALPPRDAFAVLFFVSVGMLFDPHVVVDEPGLLLMLLGVVLLAKPLAAFAIVWAARHSVRSAHGGGGPGADRRVLVFARGRSRAAQSCPDAAGTEHPGGLCDHFAHAQSAAVPPDRPFRRWAELPRPGGA
ncbi:MAG: cation:proton antiporter [Gemmataceae bacterium]